MGRFEGREWISYSTLYRFSTWCIQLKVKVRCRRIPTFSKVSNELTGVHLHSGDQVRGKHKVLRGLMIVSADVVIVQVSSKNLPTIVAANPERHRFHPEDA